MVHKMKKEFMELEAQARKMEVFVDYEPAAPVGSLFAMKCVVSDKKGARICRFAADADIATAQEHAGYMALSAYFNKEVDESLYIVRTGASEAQTQNTSNVTQGQNQANQAAGGNSRTQQNAGTSRQNGQNVPPQQGRPSAVNQQQNRQGQQKPGSNPVMPGTYNQNQPQCNTPAQNPGNRTSQQNAGTSRPNGQGVQQGQGQPQQNHPSAGQQTAPGSNPVMPGTRNQNQTQSNAPGQGSGNRAPQQNADTARSSGQNGPQQNRPAPQPQNNGQQTQNMGKPEDVRVPVALFKHREENRVSDLLKIEAGRSILRSIYSQNKLTDELMAIQPKVRAYMDYYHIPIADETFVKSGEC